MIYSDEERKFDKDITVSLIRRDLLNLAEYNIHMAKLLDGGRNSMYTDISLYIMAKDLYLIRFLYHTELATEFAVSLLQTLVNEEPKVISELQNLVEALPKVSLVLHYK